MIKKLLYVDRSKDGSVSTYDVQIINADGDAVELWYSNDESWTAECRGTLAGSICDHGNGIKVRLGATTIDLDYSQARELELLFTALNQDSGFGDPCLELNRYELKED